MPGIQAKVVTPPMLKLDRRQGGQAFGDMVDTFFHHEETVCCCCCACGPCGQRAALVTRPAELHRQPLAEPSVRLSPHWAPVKPTRRSCRDASARRGQGVFVPAFQQSRRRELCAPCSA